MKNALLAIAFLVALTVALSAADPAQPVFWSSSQQKNFDNDAQSKLNLERHLGTERMIDSAFVAFRNGSGEAELHEKLADLILVRSGQGAVLIGGKMIDGKPTAPGEVRGKSIEAGPGIRSLPVTCSTFQLARCTNSGWNPARA